MLREKLQEKEERMNLLKKVLIAKVKALIQIMMTLNQKAVQTTAEVRQAEAILTVAVEGTEVLGAAAQEAVQGRQTQ